MLQQFLNHIERKKLFDRDQRILLAVSGGVDSMVMLSLFIQAGFKIAVAHCNFQLRPEEAKEEEELVKLYCASKSIEFHVEKFDTKTYALKNSLSTQEAARSLRYKYFERLLSEQKYDWVATAHHLNDTIETVLLNLVRGSGVDGMAGIPLINGRVIRPLLFATRMKIVEFANANQIPWKEDSSNHSDDYARNLLRNKVIPLLREINPGLEKSFADTVSRMEGTKRFMRKLVADFESSFVTQNGDQFRIDRDALTAMSSPDVLLWEILKPFGFRFDQCCKILETYETGKFFHATAFQLLVNRDHFLINKQDETSRMPYVINEQDRIVFAYNERLTFDEAPIQEFSLCKDSRVAQMDHDTILFPIIWRAWREGDSFTPFGMHNRKKLSNFLIDLKVSRIAKKNITVLESAGEIIWVVGLRISEKVKINSNTKRVLSVKFETGIEE